MLYPSGLFTGILMADKNPWVKCDDKGQKRQATRHGITQGTREEIATFALRFTTVPYWIQWVWCWSQIHLCKSRVNSINFSSIALDLHLSNWESLTHHLQWILLFLQEIFRRALTAFFTSSSEEKGEACPNLSFPNGCPLVYLKKQSPLILSSLWHWF